MVVGGVGVVLHGHARLTADLDLAVDLTPGEASKAIDVLVGLGLRPTVPVDPGDFADEAIRASWIADKNMQVFSLRDPSDPFLAVDLFVEDIVPFDELWDGAERLELAQTSVRGASIPDLIADHLGASRMSVMLCRLVRSRRVEGKATWKRTT